MEDPLAPLTPDQLPPLLRVTPSEVKKRRGRGDSKGDDVNEPYSLYM